MIIIWCLMLCLIDVICEMWKGLVIINGELLV